MHFSYHPFIPLFGIKMCVNHRKSRENHGWRPSKLTETTLTKTQGDDNA
jgi:hypothetical protein